LFSFFIGIDDDHILDISQATLMMVSILPDAIPHQILVNHHKGGIKLKKEFNFKANKTDSVESTP